MTSKRDLELVDRATLRVWRWSNLAGWWLVGTVVYHVIAYGSLRTFVQKISLSFVGDGLTTIAVAGVFVFAGVTAGGIVGARVYRAPTLVGAFTVLIPDGIFALFALAVPVAWPELAVVVAMIAVPAAIAGTVARAVWRRRPSAMRQTGPTAATR
jgi:hypothetical protein